MLVRFHREGTHVETSHHYRYVFSPDHIGQLVSLIDLSTVAGYRNQIKGPELLLQIQPGIKIGHFEIVKIVFRWSHARQRQ